MRKLRIRSEGTGRVDEDFQRAKQSLFNAMESNDIITVLHTQFGISIRMMKVATRVSYREARRWVTSNIPPGIDEAETLYNFKAIVLFLAESGMLYLEEIPRFLNSRQAEIGYGRPITILHNSNLDQITAIAAKLVARMRGFGDGEEIAI